MTSPQSLRKGGARVIEMTGRRYGKLSVLERCWVTRGRGAFWACLCDCGNRTVVDGACLRSGKTSSCGCLRGDNRPLIGRRFGCWLVISRSDSPRHGAVTWNCLCDCGAQAVVKGVDLRRGSSLSCGCLARRVASLLNLEHGHSRPHRSHTYRSWQSMKRRCTNPATAGFNCYGGRGIRVCPRWMASFPAFLKDMGERPAGHSLDRIDVNGNYEPQNCRWATPKEQAQNRRSSVFVAADAELLRSVALGSSAAAPLLDLAERIQALVPPDSLGEGLA